VDPVRSNRPEACNDVRFTDEWPREGLRSRVGCRDAGTSTPPAIGAGAFVHRRWSRWSGRSLVIEEDDITVVARMAGSGVAQLGGRV
jgi:hypothetical protein